MYNIDEIYQNLLKDILYHEDSFVYKDTKRNTDCYQLNDATIKYNMYYGFPLLQTKSLDLDIILNELLWFLRGENNVYSLMEQGCNIWNKDVRNYNERLWGFQYDSQSEFKNTVLKFSNPHVDDSDVPGFAGAIYGTQWRNYESINILNGDVVKTDQFKTVIELIKKVPMARRNIVTAWNPLYAFDDSQCALPPCHWAFEILPYRLSDLERSHLYNMSYYEKGLYKVEPHKLIGNYIYSEDSYWCDEKDDIVGNVVGFEISDEHKVYLNERNIPEWGFDLKWNQRSVDVFLGLPYNIASYGALMLIIQKLTGYQPRYLIGNLSNVHIYEPHLDAVREQLTRTPSKNRVDVILEKDSLTIDDLYDLKAEDFSEWNYKPQGKIKAEMLAITNDRWNKS